MPLPPLPESAVSVRASAEDWRAAVALAGDALVRSGSTDLAYTQRMIGVIEEFGAYIVIAPGLALAHARPGPDVHTEGLAVVTLREPIAFGHPHNDPVQVVIGLAVTTADAHVTGVAELANVFNDPRTIPALCGAETVDDVLRIMSSDDGASLHNAGGES